MSADTADSEDLQPGDLLVDTSAESTGETQLRLIRCPICFEDLRERTLQAVHKHIGEHTPEDLDLTERPTPGRDMDISVYSFAEPAVLAALGVEPDGPTYTPVVVERRDLVKAIADRGGTITYAEAAEIYGRSTTYAARRLKQLHHAGWLQRVDNGRNGRHRYHLSDTEEEAVEQ